MHMGWLHLVERGVKGNGVRQWKIAVKMMNKMVACKGTL